MIGIGIDTGGTYTDAVVYEMEKQQVLASGKSLTTKEDLKIGIGNVLKKLPEEYLRKCGMLALSTTLATNACVEGKGGRGKLILIGIPKKNFQETYASYGIDDPQDVYLLECDLYHSVEKSQQPDWERFEKELPEFLENCDGLSIVQVFAREHHGAYEKKAEEIVKRYRNLPVILGHDLFQDLNAVKRGAGALLNARLVPVICEFLAAVKQVFRDFHLELPTIIVRSDGSLMNEEFAGRRPVETLLCGPAASVVGAVHLTEEPDAVIVDIGGTTTDVAIVKDGVPKKAEDGIQIGSWKTFVKGLYVDTFALGGDTAVHYDDEGNLYLEDYRIIPLCCLAKDHPEVLEKLRKLQEEKRISEFYLHEFLCLQKELPESTVYTKVERGLCRALKTGPLSLEEAADAVDREIYEINTARLEKEGFILRAGLTPTDIMHLRGEFEAFDREAALYGAEFVARSCGIDKDELGRVVYDLITEKLFCNLARILLEFEYEGLALTQKGKDLDDFLKVLYRKARQEKNAFFGTIFRTKAVFVGIGAPTHIFLDEVARLFGTRAVIPSHAAVANAVGAIVGNVTVDAQVIVKPVNFQNASPDYMVLGEESVVFEEHEEALAFAKEEALRKAVRQARSRGATGELMEKIEISKKESVLKLGSLLLEETVHAIVQGKIGPG